MELQQLLALGIENRMYNPIQKYRTIAAVAVALMSAIVCASARSSSALEGCGGAALRISSSLLIPKSF